MTEKTDTFPEIETELQTGEISLEIDRMRQRELSIKRRYSVSSFQR
jgi:hypothetical protein